MNYYTVQAPVDCLGLYGVEADSEEEAAQKVADWDGGDSVEFLYYTEEVLSTTPSEMRVNCEDEGE